MWIALLPSYRCFGYFYSSHLQEELLQEGGKVYTHGGITGYPQTMSFKWKIVAILAAILLVVEAVPVEDNTPTTVEPPRDDTKIISAPDRVSIRQPSCPHGRLDANGRCRNIW